MNKQTTDRIRNWFSYPGFVTVKRYELILVVLLILIHLLLILYANEAGGLDNWLKDPSTFIIPVTAPLYFIFYHFSIRSIEGHLGIKLNNKAIISTEPALKSIFKLDSDFDDFQKLALARLHNKKYWLSLLFTAALFLAYFVYIFLTLNPNDLDNFQLLPGVARNPVDTPIGILTVIFLLIVWTIFTSGIATVFLLWLVFIYTTAEIGKNSEKDHQNSKINFEPLTIDKLKNTKFNMKGKDSTINYSLRELKRSTRAIASIATDGGILLTFGLISLNILFVTTYQDKDIFNVFSNVLVAESLKFVLYSIFLINLSVIAGILYVFFYPQLFIKKIIETEKDNQLQLLEGIYELEKLKLVQKIESESENIDLDFQNINFLRNELNRLNSLSVWPFNYKQIGTLIAGLFLPSISLIITFFQLLK